MNTRLILFFFSLFALFSCIKQSSQSQSTNSSSSASNKSYSIEIELDESDSAIFENAILIDLSSNDFIIDNSGSISTYRIDGLKFNVSHFMGNSLSKADFTISFANDNGIIGSSLVYSAIPLQEFSQESNFLYVNHSPNTLTMVQDVMKAENKVYLYIQGTVDAKPVKFTSTFYINITISSQ